MERLAFWNGRTFEFCFGFFTKKVKREITEEGSYSTLLNKALIEEFEAKEQPQEVIQKAMVATLDPSNLGNSMSHMDAFFTKAEFNETDKFWLLRNSVMRVPELYSFTIYRAPSNYEELKTAVKDF